MRSFDAALGEWVGTPGVERPKSALEFLQSKYQDPLEEPETRIKCAIAALPFENPKLPVENHHAHGDFGVNLRFVPEAVVDADRLRAEGRSISFDGSLPDGRVEHPPGELSPVLRKR
jgi:hypothetical protein